MDWEIIKKEFEFDGSLLDIYILNTTLHDWKEIVNYLNKSPEYKTELIIKYLKPNLEELNLSDIEKLLKSIDSYNWHIKIFRQNININCYGFEINEIEFNIDPREVTNQNSFNILLDFIKNISVISGKEVVLTPENFQESIILSYKPEIDKFIYS